MTLLWVLSAVWVITGQAFAGELQQQLIQESTIEQVMKRGTLRVGMSTFVPWAMKDKTGKLIGFEIDVASRWPRIWGLRQSSYRPNGPVSFRRC